MQILSYKSRTLALTAIIIILLMVYTIIPSTKIVLAGVVLLVFDFWKNYESRSNAVVIGLSVVTLISIILEFINISSYQFYIEIGIILLIIATILYYVFGRKVRHKEL